jgi:transcriptional regulator with XRE-family HTH domain
MTVSVNIKTATGAATGDAALMMIIAARVRGLRRERQLSLDRLAARSGVSKGMLVQIERGETNPSIGTLSKVAAALGASVADLVDLVATSRLSVIPAEAPRVLWKGVRGGEARLLVGSTGPDMLELWSWHLQPGERYDAIAHPSGTQELLHVSHGRLALIVDEATYIIATDRSAMAFTDRPHAYACIGARAVRFMMVVAERHAPRVNVSRRKEKKV